MAPVAVGAKVSVHLSLPLHEPSLAPSSAPSTAPLRLPRAKFGIQSSSKEQQFVEFAALRSGSLSCRQTSLVPSALTSDPLNVPSHNQFEASVH